MNATRIAFLPTSPSPILSLNSIASLLDLLHPVLTHRVTKPTPPPSLSPQTAQSLLSLPQTALDEIDRRGAIDFFSDPTNESPPYLRNLSLQASKLLSAFPYISPPLQDQPLSRRRSRARPHASKKHQISAITSLLSHITPATSTRILDIGAGHGHLAANLAKTLQTPIHAFDRDPQLLNIASKLHFYRNLHLNLANVGQEHIPATENDVLIGLHACGALGDTLIRTAADAKVAAVCLVSCCLQKHPPMHFRFPLSQTANQCSTLRRALTVSPKLLGITNRPRASPTPSALSNRVTRHALRTLLLENGLKLSTGDELRGISRHALKQGLSHVYQLAIQAHDLQNPIHVTNINIEKRIACASEEYRVMRLLSIPRVLAGQVLEMALVLDRAAVLEEAGFENVLTCRVWPPTVSPRNLCCAAWR